MPEGPEVRIIAEELSSFLVGKKCISLTFRSNFTLHSSDYSLENNQFELSKTCKSVYSKGKKIIFVFKGIRLVSACLMYGRWHFEEVPNWVIRLEYEFGNIYYSDKDRNSLFSIVDKDNLTRILKDVGPDYFEIDYDDFDQKISRPKIGSKHIQDFLMDQKEFSGIGNYLKSEILYESELHPQRELQTLTKKEKKKLFRKIKSVMQHSYEECGHTLDSFITPSGRRGNFVCKIYRSSKAKTLLDKNGRITYYSIKK